MQGVTPSPDDSNVAPIHDSATGGDIASSNTNKHINDSGSKTLKWVNFSLICLILIMVSISIFSDSWVVEKNEINIWGTTGTIETSMGLDDIETTSCSDGTCEFEEKDIKESYEECMTDANESAIFGDEIVKDMEEYCAITDEKATAGFVGTIVFSISVVLLLVSGILLVLGIFGKNIPYANYSPIVPGVMIFLGFILWRLLLPPFSGDYDYGWGAKLTIIAGFLACYVGASPVMDKLHTSNGLPTFLSQKTFDLIDTLKFVWWGVSGVGFALIFFLPLLGYPVMLFGLLVSTIQFSEPKLMTSDTGEGEHRMLLLQFGRNYGKSVEDAPSPVPTVPTPPEPPSPAPTPPAPAPPEPPSPASIEPNIPAPAPPESTPPEPEPPISQETVEDVDWPEVAPESEAQTKQEEVVDEPTVEEPIVQEEVESKNDVTSTMIELPTPEPPEPTPEPEPPTKQEDVVDEPTPELMIPPAPVPPTNPLPPAPSSIPQAIPPPMAPMPSPPQMSAPTNLPPPPIAQMPPPIAQMPPPITQMPPPPPSAGLPPPLPLPHQGENPMSPNPFVTKRPTEPQSFSVQAAPRDDLMSSEEADDLLQDLND